jgi:hypothetical protein
LTKTLAAFIAALTPLNGGILNDRSRKKTDNLNRSAQPMSDKEFRTWCQSVHDELKTKGLSRNQSDIDIVEMPQSVPCEHGVTGTCIDCNPGVSLSVLLRGRPLEGQCTVIEEPQPEYSADQETTMNAKVNAQDLLMKTGGEWLAIIREWIQRKAINGEHVTWGSSEWLRFNSVSMADMENLASRIAASAINEYVERISREARVRQTFANMTSNVAKKISREIPETTPADPSYKFKERTYSDAATSSHFSVYPRYTPGSPAMVPRAMALRIASDEKSAYELALQNAYAHAIPDYIFAKDKGLGGIVEEVWESNGKLQFRDVLTDERGQKQNLKGAR